MVGLRRKTALDGGSGPAAQDSWVRFDVDPPVGLVFFVRFGSVRFDPGRDRTEKNPQ